MPARTPLPNPLIPGFHPDPSICRAGEDYYLACSSFEYLPGIPVFHSTDLESWTPIGHVAERDGQLASSGVPTGGGAWAPTIRHHDERFWCVVTDAMGRGNLIFTATDPAGPWSDGMVMQGVSGIDPDIAWDQDGTCYVTFSGLLFGDSSGSGGSGEFGDGTAGMRHLGIQQVRLDPATGAALEEPRSLWSGTGGIFPEAPHLYQIEGTWYLMIAEGGTERGHCVSIARSDRPDGPFEGCPANPILSARSTDRPVQNTGHGDLVQTPAGEWAMVLLGVRPRSMTRAFSPMGRETFVTSVTWADGWPVAEPVQLTPPRPEMIIREDFDGDCLGPEWVGIRSFPEQVGSLSARAGWLRLTGSGTTMSDARPAFVGRRQEQEHASFEVLLDVRDGVGGLSLRYDEARHLTLTAGDGTVRAEADLGTIRQIWRQPLPGADHGAVRLRIIAEPPEKVQMGAGAPGCDLLKMAVSTGDGWTELAAVDGRYWSSEVAESFTGRVIGVHAESGTVDVDWFECRGQDVAR